MNYRDIVRPEFHNGFKVEFHNCGANSYWSAKRAHSLMATSQVYTRKNKASLIRFIKTK